MLSMDLVVGKGLRNKTLAETTNDFRSFNKGAESQDKKRKRS